MSERSESEPGAEPYTPAQLAQSEEAYRKGEVLLAAGDHQEALKYYLKSRALVPRLGSTEKAALCLSELGRYDEALEMYLAALLEFDVPPDKRKYLEERCSELEGRVGPVTVTSNVAGAVVIDGRQRGTLPLEAPIRVQTGRHRLQVIADGYVPFDREIEVMAREALSVDARLVPLVAAGRLRVEVKMLDGADVYVDGVRVGAVPWEGTLAPGRHLYSVEAGDRGTGPVEVWVLQNQRLTVSPTLKALGASIRIRAEPGGSEVRLDDLLLDVPWRGRLPVGAYSLTVRQAGYRSHRQEIRIKAEEAQDVSVVLAVDPEHPRWAQAEQPRLWGEVLLGPLVTASLAGDASKDCGSRVTLPDGRRVEACPSKTTPLGLAGGVRGGYRIAGTFGADVTLGYVYLRQRLKRTVLASGESGTEDWVSRNYQDETTVHGPFGTAGASYVLDGHYPITFRLAAGAILGRVLTSNSGTFSGTVHNPDAPEEEASVRQRVEIKERPVTAWIPLVAPEVRLGWRWSTRSSVHLGVSGWLLLAPQTARTGDTPGLQTSEGERYAVLDDAPDAFANGITARPGVLRLPREQALGVMWGILPSVTFRYDL